MSRGLGKLQRDILEQLEINGGEMALVDLGDGRWSDSRYYAASRACSALQKRGLVTKRRVYENEANLTPYSDIHPVTIIELVKR